MMARARTMAVPVLAVLALSCCVSCTKPEPDPGGQPSVAPVSTTPRTTPSPGVSNTPTPISPTQKAEQEVLALTVKYYQVDEAIATDSKVPLKRYFEVAAGKYAQALLKAAQTQRAKGYKVSGEIKRTAPEIKELQLRVSSDRLPSAVTQVCLDVRQVKVVDKHGESVVQPNRANAYVEKLSLEKKEYGWRVVDGENREAQACDG